MLLIGSITLENNMSLKIAKKKHFSTCESKSRRARIVVVIKGYEIVFSTRFSTGFSTIVTILEYVKIGSISSSVLVPSLTTIYLTVISSQDTLNFPSCQTNCTLHRTVF